MPLSSTVFLCCSLDGGWLQPGLHVRSLVAVRWPVRLSRGLSFSPSYFAQVYMDSMKGGRAGGRSGGATDQGMGHNRHLRSARRLVYLWHGAYKRPGIVAARPRLPPAAAGDTRRRADAAWFGGEGGWGAARSVLCRCHQRRGQRGRRRHGGGRRATRPPTAAAGHWHLCLPCTRRLGRAPCAGIFQWRRRRPPLGPLSAFLRPGHETRWPAHGFNRQ